MIAVIVALTAPALVSDPVIDIRAVIPDALFDIRYATTDNFIGKAVYPFAGAFLRRSTALKLAKAAENLRAQGRRLIVYDAYRPLSVQKLMWSAKPDSRYVADPAKGSAHNRAAAVDVGLADEQGRPVRMPSRFDEFGLQARHDARGAPPDASAQARLLKRAMEDAGMRSLSEEWWHYQDPRSNDWPLLDIPLQDLVP